MVIVFGKQGQVAEELQRLSSSTQLPIRAYSRTDCDLMDTLQIKQVLEKAPPECVVINAAAYTHVDHAESNADAAHQLNAVAPTIIAEQCREFGHRLIHISTDYVFNGESKRPYRVDDATTPLGVYGQTKLDGEIGILKANPQSLILRTSWVFSPYGRNFVKTMLTLGSQRNELAVVNDQHGGPTAASSIAATCLKLAKQIRQMPEHSPDWGIYHYSGSPETTWFGFAEEIFHVAGLAVVVRPISTSEYPTPAKRPTHSVLDCSRLKDAFGISQPNWHHDLAETVKTIRKSMN
ncbi:dTDP-4-dehydrorhamnose reductase [Planctomicrobium sp. SH668]|uniref:dTDP-4-dehydrorhamnose reductase n=1 Tax=Planctomicrobium sp. SH668 TaxID=3448126 RepID=UPI003F5CA9D9